MKLRDYQTETHERLRYWYDKGYNRLLAQLFTGAGKTSGIALHLPNTFPDLEKYGLLFLSHRREILFHAYKKFEKYYAGRKWVGLEMGEYHATGFEDYVFASIDSLGRLMSDRIFKYERRRFGIIVVDEGHHATEDSIWDNILTYSGVGSDPATHFRLPSGDKPLSLFLTATPERPDGRPLTALVDAVPDSATGAVVNFDTLYAIRNGWLVDIRAYQVWSEEANIESLSQEAQVDYLVKTWLDYARDKRTLVFARSVAQSQLFAETLRKIGINAAHIDATTPKEDRDVIMPQFDGGPIQVVSNRLVFTEGYDNPSIECVLDNAPAEHFSSHLQKLGRGLRPSADARVDDYESASERKAAIARSSKPELLYISTFNPTIHRVDIVSTIWGVKRPINAEGSKVVEDVIDVIEHEEEEAPERPTREIAKISELSVVLRRADVWNQTVYNEKLKALTPLRWVICDNSASIYLPRNPFSSALDEQTPVIARFEQTNSGEWAYYLIVIGGWVNYPEGYPEKLKRGNRPDGFVARAKVKRLGKTRNIGSAIRRFDAKLKAEHPDLYAEMLRGKFGPATEEQIRYLKNHSIGYGNNLTEETASILIDDYRIRKKMEAIKL